SLKANVMSNNNPYERLYKLQATVGKLVLDGKRDPEYVASYLQQIVAEPVPKLLSEAEPKNPSAQSVKFAELADLGIITVPDDYDHATQLDKFMKANRKKFYDVNKNITDANFPNPSRVLKPGDKLRVRVFEQIVGGTTTSDECMKFLVEQKC